MKLKHSIVKSSRWDTYSLIIIIFALIIQVFKWRVLPIFVDIYYHLLTAIGFQEAGGWVGKCFWEFAPVGRPQLYPPVLHFFIVTLFKLKLSPILVGKIIQFSLYPLLLVTIWYVIRELFDKKTAFFALAMLFSIYAFYLTAVNTAAASLALIFCLLSFLSFERGSKVVASVLLGFVFYTHGYTSWIFSGAFMLYGILNRVRLKEVMKVLLGGLILASPFLIFQFVHRQYFLLQRDIIENYYLEFNLFDWALLIFGVAACFRKKGRYYFPIAFLGAATLFVLSGSIFRFLSFYGIFGIVLVNAVLMGHMYEKINKKIQKVIFLFLFVIFWFVYSPTLTFDFSIQKEKQGSEAMFSQESPKVFFVQGKYCAIDCLDSSLMNFIFYCSRLNVRGNELTVYNPQLFAEVVDVVQKHTAPSDIIYANYPYTAGMISLLSSRAMSQAMLSEVAPFHSFDQIGAARLIIWQKIPSQMEIEPAKLVQRYGLKKIADTKLAFIYQNPFCKENKHSIHATLPYFFLFLLGIALAAFLFFMRRKEKFDVDKK